MNKLGNQAWAKTKARVKKAMQDMAEELLKLYAQRAAAVGTAFSPDNNLQREFEDAFDFNETDDQLNAIADIKRDMESTQPMDRLLCGDVGYGKTEVAMRAAFKAVQDSASRWRCSRRRRCCASSTSKASRSGLRIFR